MLRPRTERRVLVVDDDDRVRSAIAEVLVLAGYGVRQASSPERALSLLSEPGDPGYSVVIVDCRLRTHDRLVLGGVQLVRTIDLRWPWISIVAMTGAVPAEDMIIETFRHGAADFLKKPFSLEDLVATVDRTTKRRRWLLSSAVPGAGPDVPAGGSRSTSEIEEIVAVIERLYAERLRLRDLAARVGLRPARIARIFRAATGVSVAEYVHRVRLARAEQLLVASNWSMTEIALAVGFYDLPHFDKAFHKWFGILPSDFRKRTALTKAAGRPALPAEVNRRRRA